VVDELGNEMSAGHAKAGGETGVNGYFYKGGQFLPSTAAEPGKWKVGAKWVTTGKRLIAPGEWAVQPTPLSVPLFQIAGVGYFTVLQGDKLVMNPGADGNGVRDYTGVPITAATELRPGVKGIVGTKTITLAQIMEAWNSGMRWFEIEFDGPVLKA
jgi:hypothetical protein